MSFYKSKYLVYKSDILDLMLTAQEFTMVYEAEILTASPTVEVLPAKIWLLEQLDTQDLHTKVACAESEIDAGKGIDARESLLATRERL